jgi:signal recognition particle subunit SRP54
MFTGFTQKVTGYMMKKVGEAKNKETSLFIQELLREIEKTLIIDDLHPVLVEKISQEAKEYLNNHKEQLLNGDQKLIQNLLHHVFNNNMMEDNNFQFKKNIVLIGDNGCGKTTFACKLAIYLKEKFHENREIINLDPYRFAAHEQIQENLAGEEIKIIKLNPIDKESIEAIIKDNHQNKIFDTAGFSNSTEDYLTMISSTFPPQDTTYIYLGNSLVGPSGFSIIEKIKSIFPIDAIVITHCDGDARCGLFLSASFLFKKPIIFISENEMIKSDEYTQSLLVFQREKILKRLVGLYDEAGLQEEIDKLGKKNQGLMDRFIQGVFDYQTLKDILDGTLNNKFSGVLSSLGNLQNLDGEKKQEMRRMITIINSMSKEERSNRLLLKHSEASSFSRIQRIAKGCNLSVQEVEQTIRMMDNMIGTLKNFSERGMSQLGNMDNINDIKDKLSDPSFISQYMEQEDITPSPVQATAGMDNDSSHTAAHPMMNNPEALRALKNFTPKQIYDMIQSVPVSMLQSMPGMSNVDPGLIKNITLEQIETLLKNIK